MRQKRRADARESDSGRTSAPISTGATVNRCISHHDAEKKPANRPTTRASDAAGAARNLGATFQRRLVPSARALTTVASSAADADVGWRIMAVLCTCPNRADDLLKHRPRCPYATAHIACISRTTLLKLRIDVCGGAMTAQRKPYLSEEAYLAHEQLSPIKHEYYAGGVYAMAGASEAHNLIAMNVAASLHRQLRGQSCRTYPSDMRLKILQTGLYTYPDFTIVCGPTQFAHVEKRDTLINPIVIIEILSPSTEPYDRGEKFQHYRTIATLQEYVLIAQDKYRIERFTRQDANEWLLSESVGLDTALSLAAIQVTLLLADIYEQITVNPDPFLRLITDPLSDI
jgi:Uma2 family endonuclease